MKHQSLSIYLFLILRPECRHSVIVCGNETDVDGEDGVDEESEWEEEEEQWHRADGKDNGEHDKDETNKETET